MRLDTLVALVCSTLVLQTVLVAAQQQQQQQQQPQQQPQPQPQLQSNQQQQDNYADQRPNDGSQRGLWPMVAVDKQDNKSRVDVHVPIVFDMNSERDTGAGKSKLDLSVLHGLVTVSRDKAKQSDGSVAGPLTVTVFGIPVYSGSGRRQATIADKLNEAFQSRRRSTDSTISAAKSEPPSPRENEIGSQVVDLAKKTNDRVFKSFSDLLDRLNSMVKTRIDQLAPTTGDRTTDTAPKAQNPPIPKPVDVPVAPVTNQQAPSSRSLDLMKRSDLTTEQVLNIDSPNPKVIDARAPHETLTYV